MEAHETPKKILTGKHVEPALGLFSAAESSFLPVFTDPLLIAVVIARPDRWVRYAFLVSATSVIGGLFGYLIGAVFFDTMGQSLIATYHLEDVFAKTQNIFDGNALTFTLIGALTPLPYKLVAITGGLLKINIWVFIFGSIVGRFLRFFLVAYITKQLGERVLRRMTWRYSLAAIALMIGATIYAVMVIF